MDTQKQLLAALKDLVEVVDGIRNLPDADGPVCEDLCGNSWCYELGCMRNKRQAAAAAIQSAEREQG